MAVNTQYLLKKGLSYYDFTLMVLIFQNTTEDIVDEIVLHTTEESMKRLHALDMLILVKAKRKSDHDYKRLRLSKKGKEILRNAQIIDYTIDDEKLYEYCLKIYNGVEKKVGNDIKVKQLLAWLRTEGGYPRKLIYKAIRMFIGNHVDEGKEKYIPTLEHLLWRAPNMFSTKWTLADSKLYQFIQNNKQKLE